MTETGAFCRIFVDGGLRATRVVLEAATGGRFVDGALELPEAVVEVRRNEDAAAGATDFLCWPVTVELDFPPGPVPGGAVALVARVLVALHGAGRPAVAACDFEDELPRRGGIDLYGPGAVRRGPESVPPQGG
ncbi:hypothetical protein [Kitasatospora sp. NPDC056184]|uniref:hypothetical protein n=1 Tax=Kitasatospora sp. NPDC056184 TaxID=3345738 RepID=UPI0035DB7FCB